MDAVSLANQVRKRFANQVKALSSCLLLKISALSSSSLIIFYLTKLIGLHIRCGSSDLYFQECFSCQYTFFRILEDKAA